LILSAATHLTPTPPPLCRRALDPTDRDRASHQNHALLQPRQHPAQLVEEQIQELSSDPLVGTRFRQRLRSRMLRYIDE
ncbi:MAG: hypothetical protein M3461_13270, partial [Pseudomonadota bacterium]|nr:hypothetical protein [Pseudomonadota bacterium]